MPFFGSCWGLQVAVTAAGGEVRANPRGREFGFARRILLSDAGREHPLFSGKPAAFEAPAIHRDEIASLPAGAALLAVNDFGVQAASFTHDAALSGECSTTRSTTTSTLPQRRNATAKRWSRKECSATYRRSKPSPPNCAPCRQTPPIRALLWKHGLGPAMRTETLRLLEIRNWLEIQVRPGSTH